MTRLLVCVLVAGACHHDPPPPPPTTVVASSTGTPVGYLIDATRALHLRDDQLARLRAIDAALAERLKVIDAALAHAKPKKSDDTSAAPMPTGRRGMGGMGGMGGPPRSRARRARGSAAPPKGASQEQLIDLRIATVHDAIGAALAALDEQQRVVAKEVLESHDVDVDVDHPGGDDSDTGEQQ